MIFPGSENLPGEHADYYDGAVLPGAAGRYETMVIKPRGGDRVIQRELDLDASAEFSLKELDKRCDLRGEPLPDWALYPTAVHILRELLNRRQPLC